jgi:hypothetical protein
LPEFSAILQFSAVFVNSSYFGVLWVLWRLLVYSKTVYLLLEVVEEERRLGTTLTLVMLFKVFNYLLLFRNTDLRRCDKAKNSGQS